MFGRSFRVGSNDRLDSPGERAMLGMALASVEHGRSLSSAVACWYPEADRLKKVGAEVSNLWKCRWQLNCSDMK